MRVEILGSGGASTTPRPLCACRVCVEARAKGIPYARTGPSVFVHGPDLLFDTPEESKEQLNRAGIEHIAGCFYSHWHPDHTMGRRVFETIAADWRAWPPEAMDVRTVRVHLPEGVARDFERWIGHAPHFDFMESRRYVELVEVPDGEAVEVGGVRVTPFRLAVGYVYAFLLESADVRVLLALDELHGWDPAGWLEEVDLAVLPAGISEHHPLTGERRIDPEHPVLRVEATLPQTLAMAEKIAARRTVLTHIEEMDGMGHDEWLEVGRRHGVEIAYDGLVLDV